MAPARTPSPEEGLSRAEALEGKERYAEAAGIYEDLVSRDGDNLAARHGLARCKLSLGDTSGAVEHLARVVEADRGHNDFRAALDYAEALWQNGQEEDAVDLAEALGSYTGRPNHRLAHAHYLAGLGRHSDALAIVEGVLSDIEAAPPDEQKRLARWVKKAEAMRRHLAGS
jgi:hypothetical protein